jgi:hypothetical protein
MNNLYNELINGSIEFRDEGVVIQHPPTSLALRAARMLKQLADTNDTNMIVISQLERNQHELFNEVKLLKEQNENYQRLREGGQQTDAMGSSNG